MGVEPGGEAGAVLGGVEPADGDVAPESPVVVAVGVALAAVDGAASRATVTASGSDEGVRPHIPASVVPFCPERVAAAT